MMHRLAGRGQKMAATPSAPTPPIDNDCSDEPLRAEPVTDDEKIAVWREQMLARGQTASDARYVAGCARYEANVIRPTRPDLAAKLDAVQAELEKRFPPE